MPAITKSTVTGLNFDVTETTLDGTDSLEHTSGKGELLILRNGTASPITPTIVGADASTVFVPSIGNVDVSGGYSPGAIAAGSVVTIRLDAISGYLTGDISITSGTGLDAQILTF